MQLIFVSVWFYWWAKHIPCLCLPCLWHSRSFWGWALHPVELSALPMEQAQAAMTWRREQSEYLPRAGPPGDLEYMERRCIPGQPLWQEKSQHQPQDSFGAGLVSDLNVWLSSASLACPWPSFPGGHPENCHHLSPGNDFPYTCTQHRHRKVSLLTQRSRLLATSKLTSLQSVASSQKIKYYWEEKDIGK